MNSTAVIHEYAAGPSELSEEELAEVTGGRGKGNFWHGLTKVVEGVGIAAAGIATVVAGPVTVPLAVAAGVAVLAGAKEAVEGGVEAYDARNTIDDGSPTREQQTGYARDALFF